jgi:hypothetical protein
MRSRGIERCDFVVKDFGEYELDCAVPRGSPALGK